MSPRRVMGSNPWTMFASKLCLSPPSSLYVLAESRARTAGQSFDPGFASLHQIQHVSSPSRKFAQQDKALVYALPLSSSLSVSLPSCRLKPPDKAWVHALSLSTRLSVSPRQVAASHRRKRHWSKLCLSKPGEACLLNESRARTAGQGLGPRFATLHKAHRFSSLSCGLAPLDKALVKVLPLSTRLSVSSRRVADSTQWTRLWSTF